MDVLLIPARWHETFSLVTREAVLAGLPVIASRVGAIPEVVQDGVNGYLLPPDDVTAWTAALQRVVKDREIVSAFHQAQLNRKIKSMDDHTMELLQLYRQLEHASSG
jgi:glycosyltransferase involved in cell wall biosynthesis